MVFYCVFKMASGFVYLFKFMGGFGSFIIIMVEGFNILLECLFSGLFSGI